MPTLKALLDAGAKVVVTAHLGRPKDGPDRKYSLAPVAAALSEQLGQHVRWPAMSVGTDALARAEGLTDGDILLLENIRFDQRETSKDDGERLRPGRASWPNWSRREALSSPTASAWCTASRPRCTTSPTLLPHYAGHAGRRRDTRCSSS